MKTRGISPKLIADLIVSALAFAVTKGLVELDADTAAIISKALGSIAAFIAPPGVVEYDAEDVNAEFREEGYTLVDVAAAVLILALAVFVILRVA